MSSIDDYSKFIASKHVSATACGFDPGPLPSQLFAWQRDIAAFAVRVGRCDLFAECGLGKTPMQLAWSDQVHKHTNKPVLILAPLAVASQTKREAEKFEIESPVAVVREPADVIKGINICNYERLHKLDASLFAGVVLDEASILKNYTGQRKRQILTAFRETPYKLGATATPAPNDWLELGNQAEFLGVMPANEMICRWFINNSMKAGGYRLKRHAEKDYWRWVSSWAVALCKPSDLGHSDEGFILPELSIVEHVLDDPPDIPPPDGFLFETKSINATGMHRQKRATATMRAAEVAALVNGNSDTWAVWCDTDYEADELIDAIPEAIEVRGSHRTEIKEERLDAFSSSQARVIITKPEIAGMGLNWQHCHKAAVAGVSFSFERLYQLVRRHWRFGQKHPVDVHLFMAEAEASIREIVRNKEERHVALHSGMVAAIQESMLENLYGRKHLEEYKPTMPMRLPSWLKSEGAAA